MIAKVMGPFIVQDAMKDGTMMNAIPTKGNRIAWNVMVTWKGMRFHAIIPPKGGMSLIMRSRFIPWNWS
jgi:hypothetical protein